VVYKPHREKRAPAAAGAIHPSWQRETEPESRWPALAAALVIVGAQTWVAGALGLQPLWAFALVSAALLAASAAVYLPAREEPSRLMRGLSIALIAALVIENAIGFGLLVRGVFVGSGLAPLGLLFAGVALWGANVVIFALWYWEIDGGGPEERADGYREYPDFVFPQQQQDQQGLAPADWKPAFPDYLYTSLTCATAFSPTDAMPYSKKAKLLMGIEATLSFAIAAMLVARAINIAKG
jgi:uncharacterized membrane protein